MFQRKDTSITGFRCTRGFGCDLAEIREMICLDSPPLKMEADLFETLQRFICIVVFFPFFLLYPGVIKVVKFNMWCQTLESFENTILL